jgi:hypothetical protein
MATITPVVTNTPWNRVKTILWETVTDTNHTGLPYYRPAFGVKSVQVTGTFNGGTLRIEGSNDGTNYYALNDPQGNALDITAAKIEQIMETTLYIRPRITAGTGMDLDVTILAMF